MAKFLRAFFLLLVFYLPSTAQVVKTNSEGLKILEFPDGTWRPYVPGDSIYLKKEATDFMEIDDSGINVLELPPQDDRVPATTKSPKIKSTKRSSSQAQKLQQEIQILENKIYKFSQDPSIPEYDIVLLRKELDQKKAELESGKTDMTMEPATINEISKSDFPVASEQLQNFHALQANDFFPLKDPVKNPPGSDCKVANRSVDEFTRNKITDLTSSLLFTYTPENLKTYIKGSDFLTCMAFINEVGPYKFLNLELTFVSATAKREYGSLQRNAALSFMLINGETVTLYNTLEDSGTLLPNNNQTIYRAKFPIPPHAEKEFKKSELDKARLVWSSGFEDYEIFHVRFIMDQLQCLDKIN